LIDGDPLALELPLDIRSTAFQRRVWAALRAIPHGTVTTYAGLARSLGMPNGARAVGSACAANPVAIVLPCHRVVRGDGGLGGYRWGLERKHQLIERERAER
jgi:AraC family transcriptional regulator of adaptative response/methylated-DNA-[protein]-cysteine methyltransferase